MTALRTTLRGLSSMATRRVLGDLADAAVASGLPTVSIESMGGVDAARRVTQGEAFDLVFLASDALAKLAAAGHVDGSTMVPLLRSQVAAAVRSPGDEPAALPGGPAFADAAALREALVAARGIGYSTGPSGTALLGLIERWGLTPELEGRLVQARPGVPVATLLADGDVDLAFQQVSELVGERGVRILGVMPEGCAIETVFAGAVGTASTEPGRAGDVLAFFASPAAASVTSRHSFSA